MLTIEELLQSALAAPEDRRVAALKILRGDPVPEQSTVRGMAAEPFVTLKECAKRLGLSPCSLWRWGAPGHELGGRRKFRVSEVDAYLKSEEFRRRVEVLRDERAEAEGK